MEKRRKEEELNHPLGDPGTISRPGRHEVDLAGKSVKITRESAPGMLNPQVPRPIQMLISDWPPKYFCD